MKLEIPPELHALATHPALPANPLAVPGGRGLRGEQVVQLIPPSGGHTLLDLYFLAFAGNMWLESTEGVTPHERTTDGSLDRATTLAWRLALSAVRTRPSTGPIPSGVPKGGL